MSQPRNLNKCNSITTLETYYKPYVTEIQEKQTHKHMKLHNRLQRTHGICLSILGAWGCLKLVDGALEVAQKGGGGPVLLFWGYQF